jgi:hypothetical protein
MIILMCACILRCAAGPRNNLGAHLTFGVVVDRFPDPLQELEAALPASAGHKLLPELQYRRV